MTHKKYARSPKSKRSQRKTEVPQDEVVENMLTEEREKLQAMGRNRKQTFPGDREFYH